MATLSSLSTSAGGALRLLDRRPYTANATWTKPADNAGNILAGVGKVVRIWLIGGGGGHNSNGWGPSNLWLMGGGGGGLTEKFIDISQVPASVAVTIGAGGTQNNDGGDTTFGTLGWAGGGRQPSAALQGTGGGGTSPGGSVIWAEQNMQGLFMSKPLPAPGGGAGGSYRSQNGAQTAGGDGGAARGGIASVVGGTGVDYGPGGGGGPFANGGLYGGGAGYGGTTGGQGVAVIEVWG